MHAFKSRSVDRSNLIIEPAKVLVQRFLAQSDWWEASNLRVNGIPCSGDLPARIMSGARLHLLSVGVGQVPQFFGCGPPL